ncbi:bZIP_1 domain-containing protein [Cephalotus follicularis]|uniref:BZIP_1 domain-containing protein n=1 Tax=Cephalotus follicularis TaxID=3775 RepID=A0A1Q3CC18_CEPFO|nr:bZIP_1 domain-containing protein [Cephalotus follicularis]
MEPYDIKIHHYSSEANLMQDHLPLCLTHRKFVSATNLNMQPVEFIARPHANRHQNPDSERDLLEGLLTNSQVHVSHRNIFSPNASTLSTDPTIDDAREHQLRLNIQEKRFRRMISNRESARRSRMRKRKLIEELQYQVNQLQAMNHQLSEKVIRLLECNHQILQENAQLKERASSLQVVSDLLPPTAMRDVEDIIRNMDQKLQIEHPFTSFMNLR